MNRTIFFSVLTVAAIAATTNLEAGHRSCNSGYYGGSINIGSFGIDYNARYYGHSPRGFLPSYGHTHRVWHDTSHYDYHPPELIRHRNHYHIQPGHYDLHRTGHWDTYRH